MVLPRQCACHCSCLRKFLFLLHQNEQLQLFLELVGDKTRRRASHRRLSGSVLFPAFPSSFDPVSCIASFDPPGKVPARSAMPLDGSEGLPVGCRHQQPSGSIKAKFLGSDCREQSPFSFSEGILSQLSRNLKDSRLEDGSVTRWPR